MIEFVARLRIYSRQLRQAQSFSDIMAIDGGERETHNV